MKVTYHKHLYQLSLMPNFFPVNCYFVEEENSLTLIDTGLSFSLKGILKTAEKLRKPLTKIVITHAHSDHVGALDGLKKALPSVEVYLPKREMKIFQGDVTLEEGEGDQPIKGGVPKGITTVPDHLLVDGDRIGSLLAIDSPGHTPGMMSFLDPRTNSLIVGDAFQTRGGIAVAGDLRWSFPFPAMATWNKSVAVQAAERLLTYEPSLLAVGHGDWIIDPIEKMKTAIERAKRKER
ncbi:MBL fold metallo-hydrolase [Halobacillus sp. BBL2006]|uniref:MBL fold metallo-hydrolase n=1 Tax=Halobacillus sp. BBL2006 TaxID=1543706 RepID=UPI000543F2F6|nr:MBL fold metallo-hydrolase [Halobacillus sp. BBL2006]KHE67582.1 hypothetical protein LD39_16815 [Halobacillus sp. BBL2006]